MMELVIVGLFGLIIGSFLNVCIYRIPLGQSINYPSSHCMACQHKLGIMDLVPVLSYIGLKGKCRYCGTKVSSQYMLIETLNGLMYVGAISHFGLNLEGIMMCTFISIMIVLTLIDWRTMLLPTSIIQVGVGIAFVLRTIESIRLGSIDYLLQGLLGGVVGYGILAILFFAALKILKKEGMGYGDVRYLGMIGVFTSWQIVLLTLFIASLVGSVYGFIKLRAKRASEPFPLGPFLSIGALVGSFYGEQIIRWYIGFFII